MVDYHLHGPTTPKAAQLFNCLLCSRVSEGDIHLSLVFQYKADVAKATEISMHYGEMEKTLQQRNEQIHKMLAEKNRHMEEVYEMK